MSSIARHHHLSHRQWATSSCRWHADAVKNNTPAPGTPYRCISCDAGFEALYVRVYLPCVSFCIVLEQTMNSSILEDQRATLVALSIISQR